MLLLKFEQGRNNQEARHTLKRLPCKALRTLKDDADESIQIASESLTTIPSVTRLL
jgi:hypothetical protein